jgi:hypothetical protein
MKGAGHDLVERTAKFGETLIDLCPALETKPATTA